MSPARVLERGGVFGVGRLLLKVDDLEHAARRGHGALQFRHHAGDLVERLGVLVGVGQKAGERAHGHAAVQRQKRPEQAHQRVDHAVDKARAGVGDGGKEDGAQALAAQALVDLVEGGFILASHGRRP